MSAPRLHLVRDGDVPAPTPAQPTALPTEVLERFRDVMQRDSSVYRWELPSGELVTVSLPNRYAGGPVEDAVRYLIDAVQESEPMGIVR